MDAYYLKTMRTNLNLFQSAPVWATGATAGAVFGTVPYFLNGARLLLLLLLAAAPGWLAAQSPQPAFRHLTTDHGLPSPEVYEVLQDRRGYLWFGTDNGVSRFDGYSFRNFGPAQGLKNNVVFYLHEDYEGRIWMVTMSENLYYYDYERDSIFAFPHNAVIQEHSVSQRGLLGFHVDSAGTVYRSLLRVGVLAVRPDGTYYRTPESDLEGVVMMEVEGNYLYSETSRAIATLKRSGKGKLPLTFYTRRQPQEVKVPFQSTSHQSHYWLRLNDETLLLYCWENYYLFDGQRLSRHWVDTDFIVTAGYRGRDGRIYLGGNLGAGVRIFEDRRALEANRYTTFLKGYTVTHILEDRRGGFWFTTNKGIFYASSMDFQVYNAASGLPDNNVTALAVEKDGRVWAAFGNGEVGALGDDFQAIPRLPRYMSSLEVYGLRYDARRDRVWIASNSNVFYVEEKNRVSRLSLDRNPLSA